MINIKNQRGSITLFVLVSCMFFIASVVCIQMNMDSKQIAVEREYKQIKSNYEKDLANAKEIYTKLSQANNIDVQFRDIVLSKENKTIFLNIIFNTQELDVKELKYGWIYSNNIVTNPTSNIITNWTYVESSNGFNQIKAKLNYTEDEGYYYLCCMVNNKEYWSNEISPEE